MGTVIRDNDRAQHQILSPDYQNSKEIKIGNHVWIGENSFILKGVTIGDGAIVAATSVVTKDVPPRCIVAGNPAQIIRRNIDWKA
jgi:acetyltransferase-like isoleucine patch superfamily enzyme